VAGHLEREIDLAQDFLTSFGAGRVLHGEKPPPDPEMKAVDRRAFFASLFSTSVETVRNVMWPEDRVVALPKAEWRSKILRERGQEEGTGMQSVFPSLSVAPACNACGLCVKVCPFKALTAVEQETFLELRHSPLLCSGCGLCVEHCPENAIQIMPEGKLGERLLITQDFPRCNDCGEAFRPAGRQLTCFDCLMKGRRSLFEP
jgi:ferredoxin